MGCNYDKFLQWAENRFGDVRISGSEIKVNSPFCEDYKHHLWCNPYGGKKGLVNGVYRCWKTDKHGSLISLVMEIDRCDYDEAVAKVGDDDYSLADLEQKVDALFDRIYANPEPLPEIEPDALEFPPGSTPIASLPESSFWRAEAEAYLADRKLPVDDLLICTENVEWHGVNYQNRIIIPYRDRNRRLIYWNARFLGKNKNVTKYMGPPASFGVGKSDVIYMAGQWASSGKLYVTEGEFNAKSLVASELNSAALGGKAVYEKQIAFLQPYSPVLCFDTDLNKKRDAGGKAIVDVAENLLSNGFSQRVFYVRPPTQFNDWNDMLKALGPKLVRAYVLLNEKPYTDTSREELLSGRIFIR